MQSSTLIDDFMHCGSALFDNIVIKPRLECFIPGKQETNKFCYIGVGINQNHKEITLDQGKCVTDLQRIRIDPGRAKEKTAFLHLKNRSNYVVLLDSATGWHKVLVRT